MTLRKHWKPLVWLLVILGFSTLLPINVGKPDFLGSFTFCSFAPVATIAMFILALTVYSFVKKRKLLLYGNMLLLLAIIGLTGLWIYEIKLPMESINVDISISNYYFGYSDASHIKNISKIFFNVVLHNSLMRDTPTFRVEYFDFHVNGKKLQLGTYDLFSGSRISWWTGFETRWIGPNSITLGPNQTKTLESDVTLIFDYTKVEGGTIEDIWTPLSNKNFTFRMDGILVSRAYYGPEYDHYNFVWNILWASTPFSIAQRYTV